MKFAVISDSHLGHAYGTELGEDAFSQFREALERACKSADFILLAGDIFDERTPRQEVLGRAAELLRIPHEKPDTGVRPSSFIGKDEDMPSYAWKGIPVISIYGTHERRSSRSVNPIQLLEKAGLLVNLHANGLVLEKEGQKIAVQGLSGVPERYVKPVLEQWQPKPVPGAFNIFMFHQSLKEYVYDPENTFISVNDLPAGFDVYIDGHIHWWNVLETGSRKVFFPGSTVITQKRKIEAEKKKGFFLFDVRPDTTYSYEFIELKKQRPFYYVELEFKNASPEEVVSRTRKELEKIPQDPAPLLMLKLSGTLARGHESSDIDESSLLKGFRFFATVKKAFAEAGFRERIEQLRKTHAEKRSVEEMVNALVSSLLEEQGYDGPDPEKVIDALAEDNTSAAIDLMKQ